MILTSFEGRIGNNLFQIAAAITLATSKNTECFMFNKKNLMIIKDSFELPAVQVLDDRFHQGHLPEGIHHRYDETKFSHFVDFLNIPDNTWLYGHFQSEKYFINNVDEIIKNFTFKECVTKKGKKSMFFPLKRIDTAFIHVRRTDYIPFSHIYPTCTVDHYRKCIDESGARLVYVFSDDNQWCIENFISDDKVEYIIVLENDPIVCLYLMSLIDIAIIANSTFSWWGAWLNRNPNKQVYYPINWFGWHVPNGPNDVDNKTCTVDMFPPGWKGR